jgi:hypothetical protein
MGRKITDLSRFSIIGSNFFPKYPRLNNQDPFERGGNSKSGEL